MSALGRLGTAWVSVAGCWLPYTLGVHLGALGDDLGAVGGDLGALGGDLGALGSNLGPLRERGDARQGHDGVVGL